MWTRENVIRTHFSRTGEPRVDGRSGHYAENSYESHPWACDVMCFAYAAKYPISQRQMSMNRGNASWDATFIGDKLSSHVGPGFPWLHSWTSALQGRTERTPGSKPAGRLSYIIFNFIRFVGETANASEHGKLSLQCNRNPHTQLKLCKTALQTNEWKKPRETWSMNAYKASASRDYLPCGMHF